MKRLICLLSFMAILGINGNAYSGLTDPGFDSGTFNSWFQSQLGSFPQDGLGIARIVTSYAGVGGVYTSTGGCFAMLDSWDLAGGDYGSISQFFHASAGETLSGYVAFQTYEFDAYINDDAYIRIYFPGAGYSVIWSKSVSDVGGLGYTDWEAWTWTAPGDGYYWLEYGISNGASVLLIDDSPGTITRKAVPEPTTLLLIGFGLTGLAACRRKFSQN